jgi:tetratricopeptide (TPR) repeat protein
MTRIAIHSVFALLLLAATSYAADLVVQAGVSSQRPYLGDAVVFEIVVQQDVQRPPDIDAGGIESLGFKSVGQPSVGSSTTIINGVRSDSYTFRYQFQFTPAKAGPLKIPSVVVRQGKQSAVTDEMAIEVIGPEPQDWAAVEITAGERSVFPGQTVTLVVHLFLRRLEHDGKLLDYNPFSAQNPPHVRISWLNGTESLRPAASLDTSLRQRANEDGPSFPVNDLFRRARGLFLFEDRVEQAPIRFDREEVERPGIDNEPRPYFRYALPLEYRAARAGAVGPLTAQLRGTVFTGVRRQAGELVAERRELFAVSPSCLVKINAVPVAGRPDTFTGGVGIFKITASAQPTKVRVGDPITVTVRVTGAGTLEEIGPPKLDGQPRWSDNFKIHDDPSPGRLDDDGKTFTFSVRPKHAEVQELPAIRLTFFNPKTKRYEDAFTDRIALDVSDTARLDPSEIVDAAPKTSGPRALEDLDAGLAANYTGHDVLKPEGPIRPGRMVCAMAVLGPPTIWLATWFVTSRVRRLRLNPARVRAQMAYRRACERLAEAQRNPAGDAPDQIADIVATYLADKLNLSPGELTPADARTHALDLGASDELAEQLSRLVEQSDEVRFAGVGRGTSNGLGPTAQSLIDQLEKAGRAGARWAGAAGMVASLVVGVAAVAAAAEVNRHECLTLANAAFQRGAQSPDAATASQAFRQAIELYGTLAGDGVVNGKLLYNMANAYFRTGDVPRAILHYRLAQRLRPRDELIAANLAFARSRVADRIEPTETRRLVQQVLFPHYAWNVRERTLVAAVVYGTTWVLLLVHVWRPRRWIALAGALGLLLSVGLAYSADHTARLDRAQPIGVLVASDVVVRKGDGETYEPQFNRPLSPGVEFLRIDKRGDWLHIRLSDDRTGWIKADTAATSE